MRVLILLVTLSASLAWSQKRGMTPGDYFRLQSVSDPRLSPDGRQIAFVRTVVDKERNRRQSAIWLVPSDGSASARQITDAAFSSSSPRWSPDGKSVAFLSARGEGRAQIFVLRLDGGEARQVTRLASGASSLQWSPDGRKFVLLSRTGAGDAAKPLSDVRHYTSSRYKFNDTGWFDDKLSHVWIADAATGDAKQITFGGAWNDLDPQWSPDGQQIAFVSDRTGKEFRFSRNTDIFVVSSAGGEPRQITSNPEADSNPRWSPDGSNILYLESRGSDDPVSLKVAPCCSAPKDLAPTLDLVIREPRWDGENAVVFGSDVRGEILAYRLDAATGVVSRITPAGRSCRDFSVQASRVAAVCNDFEHADELYASSAGGAWRALTSFNAELWKELKLAGVERVPYKAADGWDVEGFLVKPVDWQPGKSYPMVLSIHGGPAGMYGADFNHEFQGYAARGWAVFYTNPRGSTGYGRKFQRGVEKEWGGKAYTDIMSGVEAVLSRYSWIDRDRLGVTGGSYGGFMTNWIVSHSKLFKAAVTLRCISNFISDEGTRDFAFGHATDFGGDLFQNFDLYWEYSPLKHVRNVTTPTLVLHSTDDLRTPLEQGEQWFRALQHVGVVSEFVVFPRENHNLTRTGEPKHLVESLLWQQYWFRRYLDGESRAKRPNEP